MVDHSHPRFDVIKEQRFDMIKDENFVFENNTLNEGMLNVIQKTIKNNLHFGLIFFNLLTC